MLISPPFLVTRNLADTDDEWIDRCMVGGLPGQGAFPVSFNLGWHGGMHLTAPANGAQREPVRAVADGEVVFVKDPQPLMPGGPLPADHPQAYGGSWTDKGAVVIRHTTEIGEGANAAVTFFSITMHLNQIDPAIRPGRAVYRKASLGTAGQIAGRRAGEAFLNTIHFEIVCDQVNLQRLVGRASGELNTAADGRMDAVFGEMYFHLPSGTQVFGQEPLPNSPQAMMQPPKPLGQRLAPAPVPLQNIGTTTEALIVGVRYAGGDGPVAQRGDAQVTTYRNDGTTVGAALTETHAEYNLYTTATDISKAYPAAGRPAPSAVFELLRFGRVIGPDALAPANVPHWRQVRYAGGQGWVNLNAPNVHKFSDADCPHWNGWSLVDDSTDGNSRCDSAVIRGWLDGDGNGTVTAAEAQSRMGDRPTAAKLAHAVCKFPTEWNAATIDARWGWLKTQSNENPTPLSTDDFEALRAHITALAFWPANMGIDANHWHWQPREFIRQFRSCGWLSAGELAQTLPRRRPSLLDWTSAQNRASAKARSFNILIRKYSGSNKLRISHLLAQVFIETDSLNTFTEYSKGAGYSYGAFYGRGLMHLTWPKNYSSYGTYCKIPNHTGIYSDARINSSSVHTWESEASQKQWSPRFDPGLVATDTYAAYNSGGFYWVSKTFRGTHNINRVCDQGADAKFVGFASWLVNGGGNGYRERQLYFAFIINELLDAPRLVASHTWNYPPLNSALTGSFPIGNPNNSLSVQIDYERQIP
jgi:predicted chitinase